MSNMLLFDIAPDEPERKKAKRQAAASSKAVQASELEPEFKPEISFGTYEIMGQAHDLHECADTRCGSRDFDIIDEWRGEWLIECMVCGTGQRVPVVPGVLHETQEVFHFRDGIFAGLSIDEASGKENGMDYIEWAAKSHKRSAVRDACSSWLDAKRRSQ
jgi:hypothetical protein